MLTNTMTIAPYRGGSRPEPIYVTETIIDKAARELGIDAGRTAPPQHDPGRGDAVHDGVAADLRQRRFRQEPRRLPGARRTTTGSPSGARRAKKRGKLLGVGVATAVAATGGRDYEHAEIRFDPSGGVVLMTGSMDHGQGHGTTFKQVLSEKLGIDADLIRYRYGDSDLVTMGIGTFGSRSAQLAGSAIVVAADRLIEKGRQIAAHMMEAAADDVVFERRPVHDRRHRPLGRHRRGRAPVLRVGASAERHRDRLFRARQFRPARMRDLPQRRASLRGRDRRGDRRGRADPLLSRSTMSAASSTRCCARARSMAASSRGSARR